MTVTGDSENVESETESVESISDSEENMVESPDEINKRVLAVEKQVEKILKRLAEKDVERTGTDSSQNKKIQEMLARISLLEKENKALHDENVSLRLENLEIKMTKIVNKKDEKKEDGLLGPCNVFDNVFEYNHSKENQKNKLWGVSTDENHILPQSAEQCSLNDDDWQFPKHPVKAPRRLQKQDPYKNRYSALAEGSSIFAGHTNAEDSPKRDQISSYSAVGTSREASKQGSTDRGPSRNVYPREESYTEAVRKRPTLDEMQNHQGKYPREESYAKAAQMRPALDEKQNRQNPQQSRILGGSKIWQGSIVTMRNTEKNRISDETRAGKEEQMTLRMIDKKEIQM
eukprot:Seg6662.1 transcript_id=Seg6662.1/GoldUCD/mRNA.D3Y31 product="hypothetical protein" protein_id=Seg6662.1/GoldUCD/D3Y31